APGRGQRPLAGWHLAGERSGKQRPRRAREGEHHRGAAAIRPDSLQEPAADALDRRAPGACLDDLAADIEELAVLDARRTGRLAGAAGQAAVQVQPCARGRRRPLQHLLHLVDAPARSVELVAQKLVCGTGGVAKAAVHALAQDLLGLGAGAGAAELGGQARLHEIVVRYRRWCTWARRAGPASCLYRARYMRPGLMIRSGSNCSLSRWYKRRVTGSGAA